MQPISSLLDIKLRPHHFFCLPHYAGRDHASTSSAESFSQALRRAMEIIHRKKRVLLVSGVEATKDVFCRACRYAGCTHESAPPPVVATMEARDTAALDLLSGLAFFRNRLSPESLPIPFDRKNVTVVRKQFSRGACREVCAGCCFEPQCRDLAQRNYKGALLFPPRTDRRKKFYGIAFPNETHLG